MTQLFIARLCALIQSPRALEDWEKADVRTAFEDTMACAYAGWHEPVTQAVLKIYRGDGTVLIDGTRALSVEHAALIHATAGHALDYDDVQLETVSHPSVPIVPALLAVSESRPGLAGRMAPAFAVGVAVNIAIGRVLGFSHYDKGWHATSTIGPVATAAALAHLLSFDEATTRHALALAAAQAGGIQRNFGAMAKPLQAGLASAAGVRAALLAEAGLTGDGDIFGQRGFLDLYAGAEPGDDPETVPVEINLNSLSRKLYPCCYMNHRLIAAGFEARAQLPGHTVPPDADIRVMAPFGNTVALRVHDPVDGLGAKFCGPYNIAAALLQGQVTLADFADEAVFRPELRTLMSRITLSEDGRDDDGRLVGFDHGTVRLSVERRGERIAFAEIDPYPGSPRRPATPSEMDLKIDDCLGIFRRRSNAGPSLAAFRSVLAEAIGLAGA